MQKGTRATRCEHYFFCQRRRMGASALPSALEWRQLSRNDTTAHHFIWRHLPSCRLHKHQRVSSGLWYNQQRSQRKEWRSGHPRLYKRGQGEEELRRIWIMGTSPLARSGSWGKSWTEIIPQYRFNKTKQHTQKTENSNLHGFEVHRLSSKGTKLLFQVIQAIMNQFKQRK